MATIRSLLEEHGCEVRVLACLLPGADSSSADALVPARLLPPVGWPLPIGGARTLWREVGWADAVVANVSLYPLPAIAVFAARLRRVTPMFVIHGSGVAHGRPGNGTQHLAREAFRRLVARPAVRRSVPVSVSMAGLEGIERLHGVPAAYLPYPLRELPAAAPQPPPEPGEPLRVAWVGRLAAEKDPVTAVRAVERLLEHRPGRLDVYGDGPLRPELAALAAGRPWLVLHGERPWPEILEAQERAHVCLSTSVWDNVQVAVLEALARGIPVVSTRVGDAPRYYGDGELAACCVEPATPKGWRARCSRSRRGMRRCVRRSRPTAGASAMSIAGRRTSSCA